MKINVLELLGRIKSHNVVSVSTLYPEKIINILQNKDICMWDIIYAESVLSFKTFNDSIPCVRMAAELFGCGVEVTQKMGMEKFAEHVGKRKFFYVFALFVLLLIIIFSNFIWKIDIYSARETDKNDILMYLYSQNIKQSVAKNSIDEKELAVGILQNFENIAEAVVEIKGSSLYITLVEKDAPIAVYDRKIPVDLVATENACVDEIVVHNGTQIAAKGSVVNAGDVLISGSIAYEYEATEGVRYVHAMGKVLTNKELEIGDITVESLVPSEGAFYESEKTYHIFGTSVSINGIKDKKNKVCKEYHNVPIEVAGIQLPVLYDEKRWYNINDCKTKSEADIAAEVYDEVVSRLDSKCNVKDVTYRATASEGYKLDIKAFVKYTVNIAMERQIVQ